jgi:SET domain-containing protein
LVKKTVKSSSTAGSRRRHKPGPFRVGRSRTGLGLFAAEPIRKGTFIIEYTGKRILWENVDNPYNKYFFELNKLWAIDGANRRNTARYINHSCRPNAEVRVKGAIRIYAAKNIKPGVEITYDYGKEYFDEFLKPIGCKCASCVAKPKRRKTGKSGANGKSARR